MSTLGVGILGLVLYGEATLPYIGLVGGAAVYLLLQGAGSFYVPMPAFPGTKRNSRWMADQPSPRAQVLLRALAGLNLVYLGVEFKFLQPNSHAGRTRSRGVVVPQASPPSAQAPAHPPR